LKIITLVLPKLTVNCQRSQISDKASICHCRPLGDEARTIKSSAKRSKDIST